MRKSVAFCFLFLNLACNTNMEVRTEGNYEAVALPDGSQVYLNHNSYLSYQEDFNPRSVNLSGEAFFIVVPDESTFTVITAHGTIEVLGTEFNVKTSADQVAVDVKKGLVELKTTYDNSKVKRGIKAIYKDGEQAVQKLKSDKEYRKWMRSLQKDFKAIGKELKPALKEIGNDFKKAERKIGKEFKINSFIFIKP